MLFAITFLFVGFANGTELNASQIEVPQEYFDCIDEAKAIHQKIVSCVQSEIGRQKKSMEANINAASKDPSMRELAASIAESSHLWMSYVKKVCEIYIQLGGQRGELLSENCTLKEVVYRRLFVENILDEAGI